MKSSTLKYIALFNLFLGVALLSAAWVNEWRAYRYLEDVFYKTVLALKGELPFSGMGDTLVERVSLVDERDGKEIVDSVRWEATPYEKAEPAKLFLVEVGDDPDHIFQENPPLPMDYAVIFYQIRELGAYNIAVASSLTWPPPQDPLIEEALTYEVADYNRAAVGLVLTPSARRMNLPANLEPMVIQPSQIRGSIAGLSSVGRVVESPNLQAAQNIPVVPMRVETEPDTIVTPEGRKLALFVRWGNYVLPTLPLVAALDSLNLPVSALSVEFGGELNLGGKRIIPIDESGNITLSPEAGPAVSRVSATRLAPEGDSDESTRMQEAISAAQAVILGEGKTPVASMGMGAAPRPWDWEQTLDVTAAGVQSLLQGLAPGKTVWLTRVSRVAQVIVLLDVLLLATWSLTFPRKRRGLVLLGILILLLAAAATMAAAFRLWLPLVPSLLGLLMASIAAWFMGLGRKPAPEPDGEHEAEELEPVPPPFAEKKEEDGPGEKPAAGDRPE